MAEKQGEPGERETEPRCRPPARPAGSPVTDWLAQLRLDTGAICSTVRTIQSGQYRQPNLVH